MVPGLVGFGIGQETWASRAMDGAGESRGKKGVLLHQS